MQENQQPRDEEHSDLDIPFGPGGWLAFVQAGMALLLIWAITMLSSNISYGTVLQMIASTVLFALIVLSVVQFYRYRASFRIFLLCHMILLMVYYYTLSKHASQSISEHLIASIGFVLILIPVVILFFSERVKNTFCEQGREIIKQIKDSNSPVGIDGWLVLFRLNMVVIFLFTIIKIIPVPDEEPLIWSTIIMILAAVLIVICAILFYKRRIAFRIFYILTVAVISLDTVLLYIHNINAYSYGFYQLTVCGLIILALYKSQRVKNTFKK